MSGMRRKEREVTEKVVQEEILRQAEVGRLGTLVDGSPYVVPMNFCYVEDRIYLHSFRDGKKIKGIKSNPRVCFEVDEGEIITGETPCAYSWRYTSVIVNGKASVVEDENERLKGLRLISDKYSPGKGKMIIPEIVEKNKHLWIIRIDIDEMTGKKSPA
jgi:nitroimidazol reductase NimA-like FMN-containing flavoprotein (pyridoxamine 5'-phosphate oxidase superfamily)